MITANLPPFSLIANYLPGFVSPEFRECGSARHFLRVPILLRDRDATKDGQR
jgi:hypothetical protein